MRRLTAAALSFTFASSFAGLYVGGRAHVDALPMGHGVGAAAPGSGLEPTVFLRRARPELSGEFLDRWQWTIAGEWGRTTVGTVEAPSYQAQPTWRPSYTSAKGDLVHIVPNGRCRLLKSRDQPRTRATACGARWRANA